MKEIGVMLYPHKDFSVEEMKTYLHLAKSYQFHHVLATFFAVEMEELRNPAYLKKLKQIGQYCKQEGLPFQADLFPQVFESVGASVNHIEPLLDLGITEFRMDYGFTMQDLAKISKHKQVKKIILNASTAAENPEAFEHQIEQYLEEDGILTKLEASHNVNPHPETGIGLAVMKLIKERFEDFHIPVSAFVPAKEYTYGIYDVWESCPTLEDHRYWSAFESAQELWAANVADILYIGDAFASETELKKLSEMRNAKELQLRIKPAYPLSDKEREILFSKPLRNRLAEYVLRFTEFRNTNIPAQNCVAVDAYDITIDNETIHRYHGEIRIALRVQKQDPRVNVVAHLHPHDIRLLPYIKPGTHIRFVLEEEELK